MLLVHLSSCSGRGSSQNSVDLSGGELVLVLTLRIHSNFGSVEKSIAIGVVLFEEGGAGFHGPCGLLSLAGLHNIRFGRQVRGNSELQALAEALLQLQQLGSHFVHELLCLRTHELHGEHRRGLQELSPLEGESEGLLCDGDALGGCGGYHLQQSLRVRDRHTARLIERGGNLLQLGPGGLSFFDQNGEFAHLDLILALGLLQDLRFFGFPLSVANSLCLHGLHLLLGLLHGLLGFLLDLAGHAPALG
mmetsp:Transcript_11057/g.24352  ORF Transcript_11057/g.24352 Transcript_11057/m.24352 type:complete len:248 (-) Transcript_11057:894-1637(-)